MSTLPETFVKDFHDEEAVRQMVYKPFGKTGLKVSKISLGGGPFGSLYGEINEKEAHDTVITALKKGINYIDTAPYYGQGKSEEFLGKALKGVPRQAYYIATKIGRYDRTYDNMFDFSRKKTRESVEKSLKLLGIDYIDVLQIHDIEFAPNLEMILNETLPTVEELRKEGKIKFIGVSAYPVDILKKMISKAPGRFDTVLCYARYTLLDDTLKDYIPFFKEQNLALICASSHALGLLTNPGPQPWHPAGKDIQDLCKIASDKCIKNNVDLAKLAMYYTSLLPDADTFLTGVQSVSYLNVNIEAILKGLTEKEETVLKELQQKVFTKSLNWEGIELKAYWDYMNKK